MKKLFYLLFISSVVFASCTKQDPIQCNCGGSGISVDTSLVGYWVDGEYGMSIGTDFSGNFYNSSYEYGGSYSCDGYSHLSFTENSNDDAGIWTGSYTIVGGNQMTLNIIDGNFQGNYYFTKQ